MSVVRERLLLMCPEALLAFEARWPRHSGSKELAIRAKLGVTPARFYQLLSRAAWAHPRGGPDHGAHGA